MAKQQGWNVITLEDSDDEKNVVPVQVKTEVKHFVKSDESNDDKWAGDLSAGQSVRCDNSKGAGQLGNHPLNEWNVITLEDSDDEKNVVPVQVKTEVKHFVKSDESNDDKWAGDLSAGQSVRCDNSKGAGQLGNHPLNEWNVIILEDSDDEKNVVPVQVKTEVKHFVKSDESNDDKWAGDLSAGQSVRCDNSKGAGQLGNHPLNEWNVIILEDSDDEKNVVPVQVKTEVKHFVKSDESNDDKWAGDLSAGQSVRCDNSKGAGQLGNHPLNEWNVIILEDSDDEKNVVPVQVKVEVKGDDSNVGQLSNDASDAKPSDIKQRKGRRGTKVPQKRRSRSAPNAKEEDSDDDSCLEKPDASKSVKGDDSNVGQLSNDASDAKPSDIKQRKGRRVTKVPQKRRSRSALNAKEENSDDESDDHSSTREQRVTWLSSGQYFTIPQEIWDKIFVNGAIVSEQWTYYKNKIADIFDSTWHCILILNHKNVGKKKITMQGFCKHDGCRLYDFQFDKREYVDGDSPAFLVRYSKVEVKHEATLTRQLRGILRDEYKQRLKRTKPATLSRELVQEMNKDQYYNGNSNVVKSDSVLVKARSELLQSNDLSKGDFDDMIALQNSTKDDPYIHKVVSPFAVYIHSKIQYKVLEACHKWKKPGSEIVGYLDATGNVAYVGEETSTHPIFYYPLLIKVKGDDDDCNHMLFPVTDCLNSCHGAADISSWLTDFNESFIRECPAIFPTFDRILSDFSYANFHGVLHSFQSMRIQQYIYVCYKFAVGLTDYTPLQRLTKLEMCKTHLSKTFAEFVRKFFPSKIVNKKTTYEQKFIMEVLCSMMMTRSYNVLKEIYRNLSVMLLSKFESTTVTIAKESLIAMCTSDDMLNGMVNSRFQFDKLVQSDMDKMSECSTVYDYNESILKLPIYKSSSFYYDLTHISDTVLLEINEDDEKRKVPNAFHNAKILPEFSMQFGGIIPLWTSLTIPKHLQKLSLQSEELTTVDESEEKIEVEINRSHNQPAESHMNIVKGLLKEKQLEIGSGKVKSTRFVKLIRSLVVSHGTRYLLRIPRGRLNYGAKKQQPKDYSKLKKKIVKHIKIRQNRDVRLRKVVKRKSVADSSSITHAKESWAKRIPRKRFSYFKKSTLLCDQSKEAERSTASKKSSNPSINSGKLHGPAAMDCSINDSTQFDQSASMDCLSNNDQSAASEVSSSDYRVGKGNIDSRKKMSHQSNGLLEVNYYLNCDPTWPFVVGKLGIHTLSLEDYQTLKHGSNVSLHAMNYIFEYMMPPSYVNLTLYAQDLFNCVDTLPFSIVNKLCYMPILEKGSWMLYFFNTKNQTFTYYNPHNKFTYSMEFLYNFIDVYNSSERHKQKLRADSWRVFTFSSVNEIQNTCDAGIYIIHAAYRFISMKTMQDVAFDPRKYRELIQAECLKFSDNMKHMCLQCGLENDASNTEQIDWSMCSKCLRWIHDTCYGGKLGDKDCPPCAQHGL